MTKINELGVFVETTDGYSKLCSNGDYWHWEISEYDFLKAAYMLSIMERAGQGRIDLTAGVEVASEEQLVQYLQAQVERLFDTLPEVEEGERAKMQESWRRVEAESARIEAEIGECPDPATDRAAFNYWQAQADALREMWSAEGLDADKEEVAELAKRS